jgi:hypothetical protein
MENALIAKGHGYESGSYGRCTAFDGYTVLAEPLPGYDAAGRDSRVFGRKENGYGGTCYGAYTIKLAKRDSGRDLYLLVQHGGGREVWRVPAFYDRGALESHILAMPERVQFALLMTLYEAGRNAHAQAASETRQTWAQAFVDGRIKKHRATKSRGARIEIIERRAVDVCA